MKQSPFKFQGNNSKKAKGAKQKSAPVPDEGKGNQLPSPKDLRKTQPKVRAQGQTRSVRTVSTPRMKGK